MKNEPILRREAVLARYMHVAPGENARYPVSTLHYAPDLEIELAIRWHEISMSATVKCCPLQSADPGTIRVLKWSNKRSFKGTVIIAVPVEIYSIRDSNIFKFQQQHKMYFR